MKYFKLYVLIFLITSFSFNLHSQESIDNPIKIDSVRIAVIDMQKILNESVAYQGVVEQFENIRRKQRNKMTKLEDEIRDSENNLFNKKNLISKEK